MAMRVIPFFLLFLWVGVAHAQKMYLPGYVVLNNGDTLRGQVWDRNVSRGVLFDRIRFQPEQGGKKKYGPNDLQGYGVGATQFESLWFEEDAAFFKFTYRNEYGRGEKTFLRVNVKGVVSCYTNEFIDFDNDDFDGFELFLKEGDAFFQRANQGLFGLKVKKLSVYFSDCPDLLEKLNSGGFRYADEVATFYNEACD